MLAAVPRATQARAEALAVAAQLVDDVRIGGEAALREQAERFDRVTGHAVRVPAEHLAEAAASLDIEVRRALEAAIDRVRLASAAQVPDPQITQIGPGARITQRWQPVSRAGVNIPGGKDRKSTRLNSSHVKISYAVFCLKKKKKKTQTDH